MILLVAATVATAVPQPKPLITGSVTRQKCADVVTPEALVCRALDAHKRGDSVAAAQGFDEAAKASPDKDPQTSRLYAAAGNLWIEANEPAKAAADLDKALAGAGLEGQQRGEALLDRARAAEGQNDLATARTMLNEAGETIGQDPFYWYFSASLALRENDLSAARAAIHRALKLAPNDPAVLFEAGHVAESTGDDDQARIYWQQAAAADPNGPIGRDAAKAVEMLGVTPALKGDPPPAPKSR